MRLDNTRVMNFNGAFRGMRNPLESWDKSDSHQYVCNVGNCGECSFRDCCVEGFQPGKKDLDLAKRLIAAGSSDRKFLRQIFVCADITAPLYWWKEADTYKIATVANSTSTMHKLATTPITIDCFETGDYAPGLEISDSKDTVVANVNGIIEFCEALRLKYLETKDKRYWKELVRWLPEGWLQTRTWTADYETLRAMYRQRKAHKLTEWHEFCTWIETLPYAKELITDDY